MIAMLHEDSMNACNRGASMAKSSKKMIAMLCEDSMNECNRGASMRLSRLRK